ncbi:MAG: cupredoxin domain-containing protein [Actinomycetota bacterium]
MSRRWLGIALVVSLAVVAGAGGTAFARSRQIPTVTITIHYSHFYPSDVAVKAGTAVRFTVVNTDPIDHEFIVGDEALQQQEETGTDTVHDGSVPGQISVPAGTTRSLVVTMPRRSPDQPPGVPGAGSLIFACHLPGHYAYGMRGSITLTS